MCVLRKFNGWEIAKTARGKVKLGNDAFESNYSFGSTFENLPGTNPEEQLGASQAACFNMNLAGLLEKVGYAVQAIHTIARITVDKIDKDYKITSMELESETKVMPHIDEVILREQAEVALHHCPVLPTLSGVDIKLVTRRMLMAA